MRVNERIEVGRCGVPPRPAGDWPDTANVVVDLARVRAVIDRIAADVDELAHARRVEELDTAATLPDRRAERRRRLAEPDLDLRAFRTRAKQIGGGSTRPGKPCSLWRVAGWPSASSSPW